MDRPAEAAAVWREKVAEADRARDALIAEVRASYRVGASEYDLSRRTGVTRNTIRAWLGKGKPGD